MKNKIAFRNLILPKKSIFGFKILNSWNSIIASYFFILIKLNTIPYFGIEDIQMKAGIIFSIIINTSITILIINSILRVRGIHLIWLISEFGLLLYLPFTLKDLITNLYFLSLILS